MLAYFATSCCSGDNFSNKHTTKYCKELLIFVFIFIVCVNFSSPFSKIKFAIVLHQKAFPDEISFTKFTNLAGILSTPKTMKKGI